MTTADEADRRVERAGIYIDLEHYPKLALLVREAVRTSPYLTDNTDGLDALKAETYRVWRNNVWYASEHEE